MLSMTAPAGSLVKTTLVDFPGRVASAFFYLDAISVVPTATINSL